MPRLTARTTVALLASVILSVGCTTRYGNFTELGAETRLQIREGNFETAVTHAVGEATCHCVFWLVVSGPSEVRSEAWRRMRDRAALEGRAAQFVNVTEEMSTRWAIYPIYWQEVCTVSADAIAFTDPPSPETP